MTFPQTLCLGQLSRFDDAASCHLLRYRLFHSISLQRICRSSPTQGNCAVCLVQTCCTWLLRKSGHGFFFTLAIYLHLFCSRSAQHGRLCTFLVGHLSWLTPGNNYMCCGSTCSPVCCLWRNMLFEPLSCRKILWVMIHWDSLPADSRDSPSSIAKALSLCDEVQRLPPPSIQSHLCICATQSLSLSWRSFLTFSLRTSETAAFSSLMLEKPLVREIPSHNCTEQKWEATVRD